MNCIVAWQFWAARLRISVCKLGPRGRSRATTTRRSESKLRLLLRERMKNEIQLDRLRIASPCPITWEQMKGDERARFCDLCSLHVYNIAELTASEAKSLIANTEGRICARLFRRSDGTVITRDCPVGLRAIRRRVARTAGAVFATLISLCGGAFGQKMKEGDKACRQQVKITRTVTENLKKYGAVAGTVVDPNGAVITNAEVGLIDVNLKKSCEVVSDDGGSFRFANVTPGVYQLVVKSDNFKNLVLKDLKVSAKETTNVETILLPAQEVGLVGILIADPGFASTDGTTTFNQRVIRSLPIP